MFKHKGRIAIIASIVIYFILTYANSIQEKQFQSDLEKLDINKDGIYSDNEVTAEQKDFIEKIQNDSSQIAPYTLIPFAAFCGLFIFFSLKAAENYTKRKSN